MPAAVVNHARQALEALEAQQAQTPRAGRPVRRAPPAGETPQASAVESALAALDPDALSPREALDALYPLKKLQQREHGLTAAVRATTHSHDLLRRHQTQRRPGVPVRLAHQRGRRPHQHLPQDDRLRAAGRPLHGAAVGRQPEHLAVGARDPADRAAARARERRARRPADHHLERQEHVRRRARAGLGGAPRVRPRRRGAEARRPRLQRRPSSSAARSRAKACACSWSIRPATSSRPRPRRPTSRSANPSTASRCSTACSRPTRRWTKPPSARWCRWTRP